MPHKTGLYGGTFSPPHIGHKRIAEAFIRQFSLDELYIMPASAPPHKRVDSNDDPEKRFEMASLAFGDIMGAHISRIELERSGASYTVDTLHAIYAEKGIGTDELDDERIMLLCGTDMFLTLDSWHRAEEIFRIADVVYAPRGENEVSVLHEKAEVYARKYGARSYELKVEPFPISSSEIREMIACGDDVRGYISDEVYEYINKAGLYEN